MATLDGLMPNFKFIGASLWLAWQLVLFGCEVTFMGTGLADTQVSSVYVTVNLAFAVALGVMGAFHRTSFRLVCDGALLTGAGVLATVGTALIFVLQPAGGAWYLLGAALAGLGTAPLACRSILQFAELGPRELIFMAALVQVAAFAINYTVLSVSSYVHPWLFFLLPTLSALALQAERREDRPAVPDGGWEMPRWFWRFAVGVLFFAVPTSICRACFPLFGDEAAVLVDYRRLSGALIMLTMVVVAAAALRMPRRAPYGLILYRVILAVSFVYVVLGVLGPQSGVVLGLSGAVNALISLCVWVLLARVSFTSGASTLRVFAFGYGSFTVGAVAGWGVGLVAEVGALSLDVVVTALVASALVALFVALFLFRQSDLERMMEPICVDEDDVGAPDGGRPEEPGADADAGRYASWRRACAEAAARGQLSAREAEVFELLARGLSARAISDELCISYNTARNHVQRIYAKLGVHGRDELRVLVRSLDEQGG
ncbi:MAG: helix-turn-helix transcriptional regulator [Eggerthellaceae bacterium]|nr:helix-turn-helix transcriptional regulator [Eggerthellaceae bacterium]